MPEPDTLAQRLVRVPFKEFRRSRYLTHYAQDTSAPVPPDSPVPHLVRVPFKRFHRNRYIWNPSVEGPEQFNDAGAGPLVVPTWDGFRLARASRFYYQSRSYLDAPIEPSTFARHFVAVPFKPLKRSRYLNHYAQDTSVAAPTFSPGWAVGANVVFNASRAGGGVIV